MGFAYGAGLISVQMPAGFPACSASRWAPQAHTSASLRSWEAPGQTGISTTLCSWALGLSVFS